MVKFWQAKQNNNADTAEETDETNIGHIDIEDTDNIEHTPEFEDRFLQKTKELMQDTNPGLAALMKKHSTDN